ncbi:peptidase S28 [Irpex rosettiformis]|uniref:Peptidase S28 n=1 Tax=Irpex rosettiformis TaxID=378272 RepID=A0ACB8TRF5_9APHY|nr:peptidase S28 [Irpex rosettiformis]
MLALVVVSTVHLLTFFARNSLALSLSNPAQSVKLSRLSQLTPPPETDGPAILTAAPTFPQFNFTQPLDHFEDTGFSFQQRYWVDDRYYKPGGPVIVLDSGESSGQGRLPYLQQGIVQILANATNGLGIVLEHRYYGKSIPVANFTTDSLRWLNNEQALADSANFMANVQIPGLSENITSPGTPWIYYGGSYAGARSAHMRVLYPDLVYGAIASSGVVYATVSDWQYMDIVRQFAPANCVKQLETAVEEFDGLLQNSNATRQAIKTLYGLPNVTHDADVGSLISSPLGAWQDTNWDPSVSTTAFTNFCAALGVPSNGTAEIAPGINVSNATLNYASYINRTTASRCPQGTSQDECFGTFNPADFTQSDLSQTWRTWQFQVCTQWGFFTTAPPPDHPRIISSTQTLEYASQICKFAYPPGDHFAIPETPDVESVNSIGGLNIADDRLAIIDGQADPWRPNTAHSDIAKGRPDTIVRPFKLLSGTVHHWDENGLVDHSEEPPVIAAIHSQEVEFVKAWLADWKPPRVYL